MDVHTCAHRKIIYCIKKGLSVPEGKDALTIIITLLSINQGCMIDYYPFFN